MCTLPTGKVFRCYLSRLDYIVGWSSDQRHALRFDTKAEGLAAKRSIGRRSGGGCGPGGSIVKGGGWLMAMGELAAPGTEFGPCEEPCQHRDCAATRRMAAMPCRICTEPIGYDRGYFVEDSIVGEGPTVLVHGDCAYREAGL